MNSLCIIHFGPLEIYPPVQNLIRLLEEEVPNNKIYVLSTYHSYPGLKQFESNSRFIKIVRLGISGNSIGRLKQLWTYVFFYSSAILILLLRRPGKLLYYETLSSFPAWVYRRFINRKASIFIHYHEYTSPKEYEQGMKLVRLFHKLEKWLYPKVAWLSHTNAYRMKLFLKDIEPVKIARQEIFPNYPPGSWSSTTKPVKQGQLRVVYVGSMGMDTMHTRAFAEWVSRHGDEICWDIYAYNINDEAREYISSLRSHNISLKKGVNYDDLPGILEQYDVGVILYNGHIDNYVYNAPNKLFEYLALGLDVWYPVEMIGCYDYEDEKSNPRVLKLDFGNLQQYDLMELRGLVKESKQSKSYNSKDASMCIIKNFTV